MSPDPDPTPHEPDQPSPDPRFLLANERTYLAWMRTALALLAGAAAVLAVDLGLADGMQTAISIMLSLLALGVCVQGWRSWRHRDRALHSFTPIPAAGGAALLAAGLLVVTVVLLVAVLA
jgi:putative membrane protein